MHIEKNVFDNVVNTLLDVDKRSKDNAKARMDMKRMKIREHLHIDETQEKPDLPEAVYYMESSKKKLFCGLVKKCEISRQPCFLNVQQGKVRGKQVSWAENS
jgi:hypothetical protein